MTKTNGAEASTTADHYGTERRDKWRLRVESLTLGAAIAAGVAAYLTLSSTREALRMDQRAWVTVSHAIAQPGSNSGIIIVSLPIKNTGKTPARNVLGRALAYTDTAPRSRVDWTVAGVDGPFVLFPNEETGGRDFHAELAFPTPDERRRYDAGTVNLYVKTRITYEDVFGHSHWYERCAFYSVLQPVRFNFCGSSSDEDNE